MIQVLIVDDEYLVRKGLIQTLPWEKYNMRVAGEANNVQSALEFLENTAVDLVFTDITMPNDSGLKLVETIRKNYKNTHVVIITCHRDFAMIQEALRLGAIDYMVKTELEEIVLENSFSRIQKRILAEHNNIPKINEDSISVRDFYGFLFVARGKQNCNDIIGLKCFEESTPQRLDKGVLLYIVNKKLAAYVLQQVHQAELFERWCVIGLSNVGNIKKERLNQFIYDFISKELFYLYQENEFEEIDIMASQDQVSATNEEQLERLKEDWANLSWVFDSQLFNKVCDDTVIYKPNKEILKKILREAMEEWSACLNIDISSNYFNMLENCSFWIEIKQFSEELRKHIISHIQFENYSREIVLQILKAMQYAKDNYDNEISQNEISQLFNISRSYFSKIFKEIFGVHYVTFKKNYKLEKAKAFLRNTDYALYRIVEKVGFQDERYFGRIFKETVGMTPMEYRKAYRE